MSSATSSDYDLVALVQQATGGALEPAPGVVAVPVVRNGRLVAAATFGCLQDADILMTLAVFDPGRVTRDGILEVFRYPFQQLQLPRVTAEIRPDNLRCLHLACGVGFRLEGIKRQATADGANVHIYGLLRDEFRFRGQL